MTTYYWIGGSGNWSDNNHWSLTSGGAPVGAGIYPLYTNTRQHIAVFDANSFTAPGQVVTIDIISGSIGNQQVLYQLDASLATNNPTFNFAESCRLPLANLILVAGITITTSHSDRYSEHFRFEDVKGLDPPIPNGNGTCDAKGISIPSSSMTAVGNTYATVLLSDLVVDGLLTVNYGDHFNDTNWFDANGFNVTFERFAVTAYGSGLQPGERAVIKPGTGTWTSTGYDEGVGGDYAFGASGARFFSDAGVLDAGTIAELVFTDASANDKTANAIYGTVESLRIEVSGAGDMNVAAFLDINNISIEYFEGAVKFSQSGVTPYNIDTFVVTGTDATHIQVITKGTGNFWRFSKTSGVINISYCDLSFSIVSGGASWYACNSTDSGGNTGWTWACWDDILQPIPYERKGEPVETGVYTLGAYSVQYPQVLDFTYPISERDDDDAFALRGVEIGSIIVSGQDIFVSWKRHGYYNITYGVDKVDPDAKLDGAYLETRILTGNREKLGNFSKFIVSYAELPDGTDIDLQYSKDFGENWQTMVTKNDTQRKILYCEIEFEASIAQYRAVMQTTSNDAPAIERTDLVIR